MATELIHAYCAMCVSRCGVLVTVEDGRLTKVTAGPEHPNGCICVKGTAAPETVVFSSATLAGRAAVDFRDWLLRLANAFDSPNVPATTHICTWNRSWGAKYTYWRLYSSIS